MRPPYHLARRLAATAAAVATVLVAVSGCGNDTTTSTPAKSTPTPTVVNTTAAPASLRWDNYHGIQLPNSPVDGPKNTSGVVGTGYSQSPQGAVLAAIRGEAALGLADDDSWGTVVSIVTAPGPGRQDFSTERATRHIEGAVPPDKAGRFLGFKISHYRADNPAAAAVDIATQYGSDPTIFSQQVAVQWIDGDWRIVLPTTNETIEPVVLPSLDGYTRLAG